MTLENPATPKYASEQFQLFSHRSRLRLTIADERSYWSVKPGWAAPLSRPNQYLALLDSKDQEIALIADPKTLQEKSWQAVQVELRGRYLTATIARIESARQEFGATYWLVETDRGTREFITQNLQENAQWLSDDHLLLLDVDGNRFEIPSLEKLEVRSRAIIEGIL